MTNILKRYTNPTITFYRLMFLKTVLRVTSSVCSEQPPTPHPRPPPPTHTHSFSIDRSKVVPLLRFSYICGSMVSYVEYFCHDLFLISPSFGASGKQCFVVEAFSEYLYIFLCVWSLCVVWAGITRCAQACVSELLGELRTRLKHFGP